MLAQVVVDCTGDGDIAVRADAACDIGRPADGACQPMTMMYTVGNAPRPHLWYGPPEQDPEPYPLRRNRFTGAVAEARERGIIEQNPNDLFDHRRGLSRRRGDTEMDENDIGTVIVDCAVELHQDHGPGLLERSMR